MAKYKFSKWRENDKVYMVDDGTIGSLLFSFDKKKIYNLWTDYPNAFSKEELEIFNEEYPYWRDFFSKNKKTT